MGSTKTRFATASVTRLLNYVFNIWPFSRKKICTISQKFAKAVLKFCQIQNKPSNNCLKLNFFPKVTKIRQIWPHRSHWSPKPAFVNCRSLHILFISLPSLCSYSMGLHYPLSLDIRLNISHRHYVIFLPIQRLRLILE